MTNSEIEKVLARYEVALNALKKALKNSLIYEGSQCNNVSIDKLSVKQVLDVFIARDALQKQLENKDLPVESLVKISELDGELREEFIALSEKISQEERRKILALLKWQPSLATANISWESVSDVSVSPVMVWVWNLMNFLLSPRDKPLNLKKGWSLPWNPKLSCLARVSWVLKTHISSPPMGLNH